MAKRNSLYGTLEPLTKKKVIYLQPYYFQGGKWHKLGGKSNDKRRADKKP